jgi:hypothetical protein
MRQIKAERGFQSGVELGKDERNGAIIQQLKKRSRCAQLLFFYVELIFLP